MANFSMCRAFGPPIVLSPSPRPSRFADRPRLLCFAPSALRRWLRLHHLAFSHRDEPLMSIGGVVVGGVVDGVDAEGCVGEAGGGGMGWPSRTMVTWLMVTGVRGLSRPSRSTRAMEATSRTECASHWPK